jgi:putative N6-adenine-specific DNA methylase
MNQNGIMKPFNILVVVQPGLEAFAVKEINALGYKDLTVIKGGIFLIGHLSTVIKLNLACRTISRILIELAEFEAKSFSHLEHYFGRLPWQDYISSQNVCIRVSSFQSSLYHEKAISERLIDSISIVLGRTVKVVSSPDTDNTQLIVIYAKHDVFSIRMDSSGAHLHKRGYGIKKEDAPLRETVAAAMLLSCGWNNGINSLHDPMCGSGTIPMEAALMTKGTPLCEFRSFSFQKWNYFQQDVFDKIRADFLTRVNLKPQVSILGTDIDSKAIASARANANMARVGDLIEFKVKNLNENCISDTQMVVTNPPWGKRLPDGAILGIWKDLFRMSEKGMQVYLILPESQEAEFKYKFVCLLRFSSGEIKAKFIKLEV